MDAAKENEFWRWVNQKFNSFSEELRKESGAANPRKAVDVCSPPVPPKSELKLKIRRS